MSNRKQNSKQGRHTTRDTTTRRAEQDLITSTTLNEMATSDDAATIVCFICAEPVKYWSLSECNHRTCHVCALRLRVLYKRLECTFCKHPQSQLIVTADPEKLFNLYTPDEIPFKDQKLAISFETQEMMEDTLILLRFNCPDSSCDFIASGWNDLKMHVRATHGKQMCDLCIRFKKVFAHEQHTYHHAQLSIHLPSYSRRPAHANHSKVKDSDPNALGGRHPFCEFCHECLFGDDEMYAHMREKHEECFICKRLEIKDQHFQDYASLEKHFNTAHHPCSHGTCLAQKFVVFGSKIDLQAHYLEVHNENMSVRDRKDARRVVDGIQFAQAPRSHPRRDPLPHAIDNRHPAFPELPAVSRVAEGVHRPASQRPSLIDEAEADPVLLERQNVIFQRISTMTSGSSSAIASIVAAFRSYRTAESGSRDVISTVFTISNQDLDSTANIVSGLVDMLDDEEKRQGLLSAWNGFKVEQRRQFPDLLSSGSGPTNYTVATGRLLNVKLSSTSRGSQQSTNNVLNRVANAASGQHSPVSPEAYPSLGASSSKPATKVSQRTTPWAQANKAPPPPPPPPLPASVQKPFSISANVTSQSNRKRVAKLSDSTFPSLPTPSSTTAAVARQLVNGNRVQEESSVNPVGAWGASHLTPGPKVDSEGEEVIEGTTTPKGRKKKGKEKQTLFKLGTL